MNRKMRVQTVVSLLLIGMLTLTFNLAITGVNRSENNESVEVAGVTQYDWPMLNYDPAWTGFSPSSAPDTNTTTWISDLPGGTVWAHPVVAGGKLFIGAGGYLNAFDEYTGDLVWQFSAPDQPGYPVVSAVDDGKVFFGTAEPGPEGAVYALNTTTGEKIWNYTTEGYIRPIMCVEDRLYFGVDLASTGKIYCINATDGTHIWNYTTQDLGITVAVAYGKVYAGCGHWTTSATAAIYCLDMYDGSFIWSFDTGKDLGGIGAVDNGKVYCAASYEGYNHIVYALNATSGDEVWNTTRYSNGEGGHFAVAYDKVFFGTGRGSRGVYALNETNGDEIWAFPLPDARAAGGPVVADGKVFFAEGDPSHMVYAVNEATGTVVWSYELGGAVHSWTFAVANGRVFVPDHYDKKLYAFGPTTIFLDAPTMIPVCQNFTVNVNITNVTNLCAWQFKLQWDPIQLDFVDMAEGDFLKAGGNTGGAPPMINETEGWILASRYLVDWWVGGVNGDGTLANITFHCAGPGEVALNVSETMLINSTPDTVPWNGYGDVDGDGDCDAFDAVALTGAWGTSLGDPDYNPDADFNGDGFVGLYDQMCVIFNFGRADPDPSRVPVEIYHTANDGWVTQYYVFPIVWKWMVGGIPVWFSANVTFPSYCQVIQGFNFNASLGQISFNIISALSGSCNVTIPRSVPDGSCMDGAFRVIVNNTQVASLMMWNKTHTFISFPYSQGINEVKIIGQKVTKIKGDLNQDGEVNVLDAILLSAHFGWKEDP